MTKTLYLEMTESFQFHFLFNKCTKYKNPNSYTLVILYNLLGFCLNYRMYILALFL